MDRRKCGTDKYTAAVGLARMWGVMETLEGTGSVSQQEVCDTVTAWAEEFAEGGHSDLAGFFGRKVDAVKKGRRPDGAGCGTDDAASEGHGEDSLLGKIYDRVAFWEDDSRNLGMEYDKKVEELLEPLKGGMDAAAAEKVSEVVYAAAYPAGKNGFLVGVRFGARLLSEMWSEC